MKRILFVDDEPRVLDGLRRMLRPMSKEWEMAFAQSGPEALDTLAERSFDVVVSDMRMPGMDGGQLLTEVMRRHPETVRIVLSGHSDKQMILRSVGPAHQYLAKPCDPELLKLVIARAYALRDVLSEVALREAISQIESLPSLPQLYVELVNELQSPDASVKKVGEIIRKDVGMTAKVLQLVNSAFFGLRRHVSDPAQAAGLLGLDTIQALVLSVQAFSQFDDAGAAGLCLDTLWNHSMATGALARDICAAEGSEARESDHALMAGLLHDAGKLILAANLPERYRQVITLMRDAPVAQWEAERQVFGTTHAEVGAYLLGLWGLPNPIVEALAFHHRPSECMETSFAPLTAVHVADAVEHEAHAAMDGRDVSRLDTDYLERIGLAERLPAWRELHQAVLQEGVRE
jgi:HD-like signal output (HDOD) protein